MAEWYARFAALPAPDLGIGGDRTQNLLWRIAEGGTLDGLNPELTILLVGVNNLWRDVLECGPARVAGGVAACVTAIRDACPDTKVLALGILPMQTDPCHPLRATVREVNDWSAALLPTPDGIVRFVDIGAAFPDPDGAISMRVMHDACHLTAHGYRLFADVLEPLILEILL